MPVSPFAPANKRGTASSWLDHDPVGFYPGA
jgi:hypothetical protein